MLLRGDPAITVAGVFDYTFWTGTYHRDCREAEVAINELHKTWHGEDWIPLSEVDLEDAPFIREHYPVVAKRIFRGNDDEDGENNVS